MPASTRAVEYLGAIQSLCAEEIEARLRGLKSEKNREQLKKTPLLTALEVIKNMATAGLEIQPNRKRK